MIRDICPRAVRAGLLALLAALVLPAAALAAPNLVKLHLGTSSTDPEDYQFTVGNSIFPEVTGLDSGSFYTLVATAPDATTRTVLGCSATSTPAAPYVVSSSDPLSGSTGWTFTLQEYTDGACTTTMGPAHSKAFDVASAPQLFYPAGATASVDVTGLKKSTNDWSTTWLLPDGTTIACSNTAGADRPDTDASSVLPTLEYPPSTGDAWNTLTNYDGGAAATCPALDSSNEGQWVVTLQKDATHFVTLPAFSVDTTPPAITINTPADGATFTRGDVVNASYSCTDTGGSGVANCTGDVPNGSPIDTSTLGGHTFTVNSTDNVGNASPAKTVSYTVVAPPAGGGGGGTTGTTGTSGTTGTTTTGTTSGGLAGQQVTILHLRLGGARKQSIRHRFLKIAASCDHACSLAAKGTVSVPGSAKVFRLGSARGTLSSAGRVTLQLKLSSASIKAIRAALAKHSRITAKVIVKATGAQGAKAAGSRNVHLKR